MKKVVKPKELTIKIPLYGNCYLIVDANNTGSDGAKSGYPAKSAGLRPAITLPRLDPGVALSAPTVGRIIRDLDAVVGAFAVYLHKLDCDVNGVDNNGSKSVTAYDCPLKPVP